MADRIPDGVKKTRTRLALFFMRMSRESERWWSITTALSLRRACRKVLFWATGNTELLAQTGALSSACPRRSGRRPAAGMTGGRNGLIGRTYARVQGSLRPPFAFGRASSSVRFGGQSPRSETFLDTPFLRCPLRCCGCPRRGGRDGSMAGCAGCCDTARSRGHAIRAVRGVNRSGLPADKRPGQSAGTSASCVGVWSAMLWPHIRCENTGAFIAVPYGRASASAAS